MGAVKDHSWGAILFWWAREKAALVVEAGLIVEKGIGKVEVSVELVVVKLDGYGIVRVLVNGPDKADQV